MVLLSLYDLGLPPLEALVLFSLNYWILTRIRRSKLLKKVDKSSTVVDGSGCIKEGNVTEAFLVEMTDDSDLLELSGKAFSEEGLGFEHETMLKNNSLSCSDVNYASIGIITDKEGQTDIISTAEDTVKFVKSLPEAERFVSQSKEMHKVHHDIECQQVLSGANGSPLSCRSMVQLLGTGLNFQSLELDMPEPIGINDVAMASDLILPGSQSCSSSIMEENEVSLEENISITWMDCKKSEKQNSSSKGEVFVDEEVIRKFENAEEAQAEVSCNLTKGSSIDFDDKDHKILAGGFFCGDVTKSESEAKYAEENEDAKSQLSGGTNETSEDSGVDNVERIQNLRKRQQSLSKSESGDSDSCIGSTLVSASENDVTELEEILQDPGDYKCKNGEIHLEVACEKQVAIVENQFMEAYTSFLFPQHLSGLLIGKNGSFVKALHRETGATLNVLPYNDHLVAVTVVALSCDEVLNGLTSLREKFSNCVDVDFDTVLEESCDVIARKKSIGEEYLTKYTHVSEKYLFPTDLVGMLIGKNGSAIDEVSVNAGVEINVDAINEEQHLLTIIGLPDRIQSAKQMIKANFPSEEFPQLELNDPLPQPQFKRLRIDKSMWMMPSDSLELVKVTSIVSADHFFVQRIMLPSYGHLKSFCLSLNHSYSCGLKDALPQPIRMNTLCVVELNGSFYRGITTSCRRNDCTILFADFGGQKTYKNSDIYVIRNEFVHYTFQAVECFLDGVEPLDGVQFSAESLKYMQKEIGNKEVLMKALYTDHAGRTHVQIFGCTENGEEVNFAKKASSENIVSYVPSCEH